MNKHWPPMFFLFSLYLYRFYFSNFLEVWPSHGNIPAPLVRQVRVFRIRVPLADTAPELLRLLLLNRTVDSEIF